MADGLSNFAAEPGEHGGRLLEPFGRRAIPIVHLVRFPQLTINHGIVLFGHQETEAEIRFAAYDPNRPPSRQSWFIAARNRHFTFRPIITGRAGVNVIEIFRGWFS